MPVLATNLGGEFELVSEGQGNSSAGRVRSARAPLGLELELELESKLKQRGEMPRQRFGRQNVTSERRGQDKGKMTKSI